MGRTAAVQDEGRAQALRNRRRKPLQLPEYRPGAQRERGSEEKGSPMTYEDKSDALLRYMKADALRRAKNARGPQQAQAADRMAKRIQDELNRRSK